MRSIALTTALVAAAAVVAGCSAKPDNKASEGPSKNIAVGDFRKIMVAGSHEVDVRTGSGPSVRIEGPDQAAEQLVVEVKGNALRIRSRNGSSFNWGNSPKLRITVTVPALDEATIAGSGTLSIDRVKADDFKGSVAGSAELAIADLEARTVNLRVAGSGQLSAAGKTERADFAVAGSGDLDASALASRDVKLTIAGSGDVTAKASGTVTGEVVGSGRARITGGAACTVRKMGSGSVDCS